ncbi:MAG: HD domain-containing protein [Gaiellales bacterium]|nr:MAG: HD domain-containing protein [Gaiellales bacterium]
MLVVGGSLTLRRKTLLVIGLVLVCLIAIVYFFSNEILLGGFAEVESERAAANVLRARDAVTNDLDTMAAQTRDWSFWDDTYQFIDDENAGYIERNLEPDETFVNQQVNFMLFINAAGELVYSRTFDVAEGVFVPPSEEVLSLTTDYPLLLEHADPNDSKTGIIMMAAGPALVASQPIVTSEGEGPIRGSLVLGRYIHQDQVDAFSDLTHLAVSIMPYEGEELPEDYGRAKDNLSGAGDVFVQPLDKEAIAGYTRLDDINGQPALVLKIEQPRQIYGQGLTSMRYFIYALIGVGLASILAIILLLERMVLSRMARLSGEVTEIAERGDHKARVHVSGNDELSRFGEVMNRMLAALEQSQEDLRAYNDELDAKVRQRTRELRDRVATLRTLSEIDREVNAAMHVEPLLKVVCMRTAELLGAPVTLIALADGSTDRPAESCGLSAATISDRAIARHLEKVLEPRPHGNEGDAAVSESLDLDDPVSGDFYRQAGARSGIMVPLRIDGAVLGVIEALDDEPREWRDDEVQALELLAGQLTQALGRARLYEMELARRGELSVLFDLSRDLNESEQDPDVILAKVTRHAVENIKVTFAIAALIEGDEIVPRVGYPIRILDYDLVTHGRGKMSSLPFIRKVIEEDSPVIVHRDGGCLNRLEQVIVMPGDTASTCIVPLRSGDSKMGILILGESRSAQREPIDGEKLELARSMCDQTASALKRAELFQEIQEAYMQTVLALANAVNAKDSYTADHGQRMGDMAMALGEAMEMGRADLETLRYGAILHDVGKIGVPDSILLKPGSLDHEEWQRVKEHPAIGEQIVTPVRHLAGATKIVRHHHERFDGSGYPDGLAGENIPLGARILTVVDAYCAMTDERVYKSAVGHDEAIEELKAHSGTQFDPAIVDAFIRRFSRKTDAA